MFVPFGKFVYRLEYKFGWIKLVVITLNYVQIFNIPYN